MASGFQVLGIEWVEPISGELRWREFDLSGEVILVESIQEAQIYSDTAGVRQHFEPVKTTVRLTLATDKNGRVCEALLETTQAFWKSAGESHRRFFKSRTRPLHGIGNAGTVVIYENPEIDKPGARWYFLYKETFIAAELSDEGVSGTLYSFVQNNMRFASSSGWLMVRPADFLSPAQILAFSPERFCRQN